MGIMYKVRKKLLFFKDEGLADKRVDVLKDLAIVMF